MNLFKHDCFFESSQKCFTILRMAPEVALFSWTGCIFGFVIAEAPIIDGLELAKVTDKYYRYVPEAVLWFLSSCLARA